MTPLRVFFAAFLLIGSLVPVHSQEQAPPYRVPDREHDGHFRRPDGANCAIKGDHPCHCPVICDNSDSTDGAAMPTIGATCQWYCNEDHCTCHPCLEGECGEHDDHAQ
jgi:hypothetical protein